MSDDRFARLRSIAGPVSRETFRDLLDLSDLLRHWNDRINLVAPSTVADLWDRHILDSAQVLPLAGAAIDWADLGSGGGFPGLVIAALLKGSTTGGRINLIESNRKKAAFLLSAVARLQLPAAVFPERIEAFVARTPHPEVITARALASLPKLLDLASPWLTLGGKGLFHKGREYRAEVAESRQHWIFDLVEHPSKVEADGAILEITRLRPRREQ